MEVCKQFPWMLLDIDLTGLRVEVCHLLVGHVGTLSDTHSLHICFSQRGVMETLGSMQLAGVVVIDSWALDTRGTKLTHLLMQGLAFTMCGDLDHVVSLTVATAGTGRLLTNLIGALPVKAFVTHAACHSTDDPPVWHCLSWGIVELVVDTETTLTI